MTENRLTSTNAPLIGSDQISLLEKLSNACAVSGDESEVRTIVLEQVKEFCDNLKVDALGNVLAWRKARAEPALRVMLAAHMDEVGMMLVDEDEGGLYQFALVGGLQPRYLVGKAVWVGKQHIPGVIGARPIHLISDEDLKHPIPVDSLRIDLGPDGKGKAKPGDRAAFATLFQQAGPSLRGKALDDRLGVASLIELIKYAPPNIDLAAAFTVQEEVGLRGARVAAYALDPQVAIALDCTPANDFPAWDGSENTHYNSRLGAGPAIYIADGATLSDPRLVRLFLKTAEEEGIPCQIRQPGAGGTDAGAIHLRREGIPSVSVSVPGRYLHSPISQVRLSDWKHTLSLIYAVLTRMSPEMLKEPR